MLVDAIVAVLTDVLTSVLGLFSWTSPAAFDVASGAAGIAQAAAYANAVFPITTCITFIAAGAAFDLTMTGAQAALMIYRLIPFKLT